MLSEKIARNSAIGLGLIFLVGGCASFSDYYEDEGGNKIREEIKERREQRRYHLRQKNYGVPRTELALFENIDFKS